MQGAITPDPEAFGLRIFGNGNGYGYGNGSGTGNGHGDDYGG